jgi:accessory gene regulator protein AgrB
MFISSLLPTVFGLVGKYISPNFPERWLILFLLCCFILNLILVQKFAPAEVKERPLRSEQKRRFKLLGLVFTGLWLMLVMLLVQFEHKDLVVASALGFLWQGVTLTPSGFHIYKQLSNLGTKKEGKVRS